RARGRGGIGLPGQPGAGDPGGGLRRALRRGRRRPGRSGRGMNWRAIRAIVGRDLMLVMRARAVFLPLIVVPVLLFVLMPAAAVIAIRVSGEALEEFRPLLDVLPPQVSEALGGGSLERQILVYLLEYQFATFFLIVPIMVCAVIAADSFAGEKERKTLEALLYSPTSDRGLYLAKLLGPLAAAIGVSIVSWALYVGAGIGRAHV